jgi:hypothetical protein
MKQILIALCIITLSSFNSLFANNVPGPVEHSFEATFGRNTDVTWSESNGLYKASFTIGSERVIQFYNADGDEVAVAQYLSIEKLPASLQSDLKKYTTEYKVSELFEISDDLGSSYYVTLTGKEKSVVMRSVGNVWKTFSKIKK